MDTHQAAIKTTADADSKKTLLRRLNYCRDRLRFAYKPFTKNARTHLSAGCESLAGMGCSYYFLILPFRIY
jgi:hypothetical protein